MSAVKKKRDIIHEVVIEEEDAPATVAEVLEEAGEAEEAEPDEVELVEFEFRGNTYVIPKSRDDWSTAGLAWLAKGEYAAFVEETLEIAKPGQWRKVCALCPRRHDFREFFAAFSAVAREECTE